MRAVESISRVSGDLDVAGRNVGAIQRQGPPWAMRMRTDGKSVGSLGSMVHPIVQHAREPCGRRNGRECGRGDADLGTEISTEPLSPRRSRVRTSGLCLSRLPSHFHHCKIAENLVRAVPDSAQSNGDSRKPHICRRLLLRTRDSGREEGSPMALYTLNT